MYPPSAPVPGQDPNPDSAGPQPVIPGIGDEPAGVPLPARPAQPVPPGETLDSAAVVSPHERTPPPVPGNPARSIADVAWPPGPIPPPLSVPAGESRERHARQGRWVPYVVIPIIAGFVAFAVSVVTVRSLEDPTPAAAPVIATVAVDTPAPVATSDAPTTDAPATDAPPAPAPAVVNAIDAAGIGSAVIPSVVTVQVGSTQQGTFVSSGSGSGVIIDEAGYIVTNEHVASVGSAVQVVLSDGRVYDADVLGLDTVTDLAVLKINATGLTAITLGSSGSLRVGDDAVAVGSPLGLEGGPSLTVGVISAFDRLVQTDATTVLYGMLQTDAPITQGSSGGALVDDAGRLIGITTAVGVSSVGVEGIGFATPVEIVERVMRELIDTGAATHAFLGIVGSTSFDTADDGARVPAGVAIQSVEPGSAAASAGLEAGDVITSIDGAPVATMNDLIVALRRLAVGDQVEITINDGSSLPIALGRR